MIEILSDIIYFQRSQSRRMILPDTDYNSSPIDWCEDNYLYTPHVAGEYQPLPLPPSDWATPSQR